MYIGSKISLTVQELEALMIEELKKIIATGEKIDVEFKRAEKDLNKDVYETVCSFNNRNGGDLFLGIEDKTKKILGVDPDSVDKMIKNFTTAILMK